MILDFAKFKDVFETTKGPGYPTYKPKYGKSAQTPIKNKIKVFTMPPSGGVFGKRVLKHYGLGAEGKGQAICPKTLGNANSCPVCEWIAAAHDSGDPLKVKKADSLRQGERFYLFVADIDLLEKENKKFVGVYDAPPSIYRKIVSDMVANDFDFTEWKSPVLEISGHEQGVGKPKKLEISIALHKMSAQIIELDPKEWLDLFPNEADLVKIPTPEQLSALLHGKEDDEQDSKWEKEEKKPEEKKEEPKLDLKTQLQQEKKEEPKAEEKKEVPAASSEPKKRPTLDDLLKK